MVKKDIVELLKKRGIYKDISEATLNKKTKKDLENLLNQDEPLDFGQLTTETTTISGSTYSQAHYDEYNRTGDKNIFEEVIDKMMLDGYPQEFKDKVMSMSLKEKRMAILSLLDKDRNLFMKIKSLVGTDVSKMVHIKDVVSMLRAYVKVGEVEKKTFGEVMTPLELVKEMLATLPVGVWSNPDLKWLDSCNGAGAFLAMVTWRLMEGLKEWEPDHDKRYKHIVENMIYAGELQPKNMFLWMCLADPLDEFKLNVYTGSFLESGFDKHMKDVWGLEKFDIVVGNPPYQRESESDLKSSDQGSKKLWMEFVDKCITICDNIIYITPNNWISKTCYLKEIFKVLIQTANIDNDYLHKTYFAKVGSTFSYYFLSKERDNNISFIFNDGIINDNILDMQIIPMKDITYKSVSIFRKLQTPSLRKFKFTREKYKSIQNYDRLISIDRSKNKGFVFSNTDITTTSSYWIEIDNNLDVILENMNSIFYKFIIKNIRSGMAIVSTINDVPIYELPINDSVLIDFFKLSNEEVEYLKK